MEMFNSEQAARILWRKRVVVIGDSIQRSIYKDLVRLLVPDRNSTYLTSQHLKTKGELQFLGDKLLQGGQLEEMNNGINYREVRQFNNGTTMITFYFVTRCYSEYMKSVLCDLKIMQPHVVIMNSCLWDIHRYGPYGLIHYIDNMYKLMSGLKIVVPDDAIFIWNATLPLDSKCKGGFLLPYFENIPSQEIIEANCVASNIVVSHGFMFLDLYSVFMNLTELRETDGTHWNHVANRIISNHLLTLLSYAWNLLIPKPLIQDPRVHRLNSTFPTNPLSSSIANQYCLPQMTSHERLVLSTEYFSPKPTIRDPRNPLSEFSNKPVNYTLSQQLRYFTNANDIERNRAILMDLQHTTNLLRDRFPVGVLNSHPISPANHINNPLSPVLKDSVLLGRANETLSTSRSDNPFAYNRPPPQMVHLRSTSFPPERALLGTPSLSDPSMTQRLLDLPPQKHPLYNTLHHRNLPFYSPEERSQPEVRFSNLLPSVEKVFGQVLRPNPIETLLGQHLRF